MFIVYQSHDEIIVTTPENEPETIQQVRDRDLENDFDRTVSEESMVIITPRMRVE